MTGEEARQNQDRLAEYFSLSHWYGVRCEKCCGVFPKLISGIAPTGQVRYECEVCGKTTEAYPMPWLAEKAWNEHRFTTGQGKLF